MKKIVKVSVLVALPLLAGIGWLQHSRIQAWYYVWQLSKADATNRDVWIERVAKLDQAAVWAMMRCLDRDQELACNNVLSVLEKLTIRWGAADARTAGLLQQLSVQYPTFSWTGRHTVLQLQSAILHGSDNFSETILSLGRRLAAAGLEDRRPEVRLAGVRLGSHPGLNLFPQLMPLLSDPVAEVRAAALVAVAGVQKVDTSGTEDFLVSTEDLLHYLHDADADVRRLCETTLRGRGLSDGQVELGRLITHEQPQVRLQVLGSLRQHRDLDWRVWIKRLCADQTPAVRAAAIRAAIERKTDDLLGELQQIAQNDPIPTVRQIAQHYLRSNDSQIARPNRSP